MKCFSHVNLILIYMLLVQDLSYTKNHNVISSNIETAVYAVKDMYDSSNTIGKQSQTSQ
jgi:uncharacterized phage protein gp47/JayE